MAHRRLAGVALPVGGGQKARRGVEGQVRRNSVESLQIERQKSLQPLDSIEDEHPGNVKGQQGQRIFERALLALRIDAREPPETTFERRHERRQKGAVAANDSGDMLSDRHGRENDERENKQNL